MTLFHISNNIIIKINLFYHKTSYYGHFRSDCVPSATLRPLQESTEPTDQWKNKD